MTKDVIFDIDGTLADVIHRRHHRKVKNQETYEAYISEMPKDPPIEPVVWMLKTLSASGCRILIVTCRRECEREMTEEWFSKNGILGLYEKMYMKSENDADREDQDVKKEMLQKLREDGYNPYMVFDDRDGPVKMWRDEGIQCMQVNYGNF